MRNRSPKKVWEGTSREGWKRVGGQVKKQHAREEEVRSWFGKKQRAAAKADDNLSIVIRE